ncbi:Crp/Fnr family transcriptional regulator [Saccharothrix sp. Mg75]|uniref:Crp/Fnr family transcriptional regulator n=1 Tax=Saccharothrix sp. Mg75 TaxID=3445357 RepID=UPI003EED2994
MIGGRRFRGLLGRLSEHTAQALLDSGARVDYASDDVLLHRGDDAGHVVLLLTGAVKVHADAPDRALLGLRTAGDLVGEMAALDGAPRSATVVACAPVTARLIDRRRFRILLDRHHELFVELARTVVEQIRWSNELRRVVSGPASARVGRVLLHLARSHGHRAPDGTWTLAVGLGNVELASIAGMKPRTAEKGFAELRDAGLVRTHTRRVIAIPDLEGLNHLVAGGDPAATR